MFVKLRPAMIVAISLLAVGGCQDARAQTGDTTAAPVPFDKFHVAKPARWHVALSLDTSQTKLIAYVPEGQSRQHWTDMLSVIVYDKSVYTDLNDIGNALAATYDNICSIPAMVAQPKMTNDNGSAASLQNAGVQVGASIGLSALAATASIVTKHHLAGHTAATALTDGYVAGLLIGAAVFSLGALVALLTINIRVSADEVAGG